MNQDPSQMHPQNAQQPRQQMPPMRPQQTPPSAPQSPQKKSKRGLAFWIAITVALIAICGCIFFGVQSVMGGDTKGMRDPNMSAGQLEGKTEEEIIAELNRMVEEGMFNISIASTIEMENGADEADVQIENVPGNRYLMQVTVVRDDNGEEIYKTGIIEPNYHIQSAKLDTVLPQGVYDCTATFKALDPETEEEVGQASAKLTIYVKS